MGWVDRDEFWRCLGKALKCAGVHQQHALLCVDLDGLKAITDTDGQTAASAVLRQCSDLLLPELQQDDLLTQLDDNKLGLLLLNRSQGQILQTARLLRAALQNSRLRWQDKIFRLGVNTGLVPITDHPRQLTDVRAAVEAACREAKRRGNNCIHTVHPEDVKLSRRQPNLMTMRRGNDEQRS